MRSRFVSFAIIFAVLLSASILSAADSNKPTTRPANGDFHDVIISPNVILDVPAWIDRQNFDGLTEDQIKTLQSIREIRGSNNFVMTYYGNYIPDGLVIDPMEIAGSKEQKISCSTFSATTPSGDPIFAYNNDNAGPDSMMIIFSKPPRGYASMCITSTRFCGFYEYSQNINDLDRRDRVLIAVRYPFDSINEYGVTMSPMYIDGDVVYDPNKLTIHGLNVIALVMHSARNVNEAITLIRRYNNSMSHEIHYLLSDVHGNSCVVEYWDNDVVVTWKSAPYQICTNNRIDGYQNNTIWWQHVCYRYYNLLLNLRNNYSGILTEADAFILLQSVAPYPNNESDSTRTVWSSVYNKISGRWQLVFDRQYGTIFTFDLPMITDVAIDGLTVLPKKMDLKFGKKLRINTRIKNTGIRQSAAAKIEFYLSKTKKVSEKSVLIRSMNVAALNPGGTQTLRLSKKLTKKFIKHGSYYVIARLDAAGLNNDPTPADNLSVSSAKITIRKK